MHNVFTGYWSMFTEKTLVMSMSMIREQMNEHTHTHTHNKHYKFVSTYIHMSTSRYWLLELEEHLTLIPGARGAG